MRQWLRAVNSGRLSWRIVAPVLALTLIVTSFAFEVLPGDAAGVILPRGRARHRTPTPTATAVRIATPPPPTSTPTPPPTATRPPATATRPPATATRPPATATMPPATATRPPATATRAPATPTPPPATATPIAPLATATPAAGAPRLLFGLGPEPDGGVVNSALNKAAPLGMYTSWYNGPGDLSWLQGWKDSGYIASQVYGTGRAAHVVIWSGGAETGTPCGRQYPISDAINADMVRLAKIWAGSASGPPLYVTLFTEFQTYPCEDNQWKNSEAYYTKLQQKMIEIRDIFHQNAPNARVSIGWGGWQLGWDNPADGEGASLLPYFDGVMKQMDFQSFQAMGGGGNVVDVRAMTKALGSYGPVMLAHYKPDNGSDATFLADVSAMMTDSYLAEMKGYGLFAWSWMDQNNFDDADEAAQYQIVRDAVLRYGTFP